MFWFKKYICEGAFLTCPNKECVHAKAHYYRKNKCVVHCKNLNPALPSTCVSVGRKFK